MRTEEAMRRNGQHSRRFRWLVLTALLPAAFSLTGTDRPVAAAPVFELPFTCGQSGWLASTWDAHYPSVYNIDFNRSPDDGEPVRASADGVVVSPAYTGSRSNPIGINHDGGTLQSGWATLYLHMRNTVPNGTVVTRGDVIGYVSNVGSEDTGIHLHYEQRNNWVNVPATFSNWTAPYNAAMKTGLGVAVPASTNCPTKNPRRTTVAMAANGDGRLEQVGVASNGAIYQRWQTSLRTAA
jgi:hypothetical protein